MRLFRKSRNKFLGLYKPWKMIDQIRKTIPSNPGPTATRAQLSALQLALIPADDAGAPLWKALGEQWRRREDDPTRRRIGQMITTLLKWTEVGNKSDIQMIWNEITNVIWQRDQEAAKAAILGFAKYVAAQESRVGDVTEMTHEQAHRTLRRMASLNATLNALATWWEQEQELWQCVLQYQLEQEERLQRLENTIQEMLHELYRHSHRERYYQEHIGTLLKYLQDDKWYIDLLTKLYEQKCAI